jgi:hypothetical protein
MMNIARGPPAMKPDLRLLLAVVVGAAIGLIVGYTQRSPLFHGVDLIGWIDLEPRTAIIWPAFGALILAGVWTLFRSKA